MKKKILKGLKNVRVFPITTNTETAYAHDAGQLLPGAMTLTLDPQTNEWKVNADDTIYDAGADYNGLNGSMQLAELSIELKAHLEGGTYDNVNKEYDFSSDDLAPEIGMSFSARTSDGQYRMVKLWALRVTRIRGEYRTKGEGDSASPVTIDFVVTSRKADNKVKREKDTTTDADLSWLQTLETLPAPPGP